MMIFFRNGPFPSDVGIVSLNPSKGTYWDAYINSNFFDSYGCAPPNKLSRFIIKRNGYCLYSEYKIQDLDCFCVTYCLYITYLKKVVGRDFKSAALTLYF